MKKETVEKNQKNKKNKRKKQKQKHALLRKKKNNRFEKKLFDNKKQNSVYIKQNQTPLKKHFLLSNKNL